MRIKTRSTLHFTVPEVVTDWHYAAIHCLH